MYNEEKQFIGLSVTQHALREGVSVSDDSTIQVTNQVLSVSGGQPCFR